MYDHLEAGDCAEYSLPDMGPMLRDTWNSAAMPPAPTTIENHDTGNDRHSFDGAVESMGRILQTIASGNEIHIVAVNKAAATLAESILDRRQMRAALDRLKSVTDYRYGHPVSMAVLATIMGRHMALHRDELENLVAGCALYGLGMITLPRESTEHAQQLCDNNHHIFSGHMNNPLLARVATLLDTYISLVTPHPNGLAYSTCQAIQILLEAKGTLFQASLVEQFIQAMGVYPCGSLVELNTGEVAIVVKQNNTRRLRPQVVIVLDSGKHRKTLFELADLSAANLQRPADRWIVHRLAPGSHGVSDKEFFI